MTRLEAAAQRLRVAGRILGLCAGLALTACGGGGGGGGADSPPPAPAIVAPSIGTQPLDTKVIDGATATFNVTAAGSSLTYQWQRDGKAIAGATGASYTTPVLRMADNAAKFQVVVTGPNASVTSNAVTLTVTPIALSLSTQPKAQTGKDGEVVSFDVAATGSEPIQYQWQRNGVALTGADKASYTTPALALADDAAVFKVVVTNPAGTVTSQEAKLTVTAVAPRIVTAPESVTTSDGATVTFKVTAAGSAPLAYQWLRNGSAISGATGTSYTVALAYAGSGDRYSVQVSNGTGQIVSDAAVATVNANAPAFSQHPADVSISTGGSASFTATASGTAPLRYQWQQSQDDGLSWTNITGATSATYAVSNATLADAHTRLRVAVSNTAATLNSNVARLSVQANVRILAGTTGGMGYADGKGSAARLGYVWGMGVDAAGNIYVADNSYSVIRRVSPDGTVQLFAGKAKTAASVDGALADARFSYPTYVAADRTGNLYVAENCVVRRIAADRVSSFVGGGNCTTRDGTAGQSGFGSIMGMTVDADGNVYVSEFASGGGQLLRKATPAGVVTTLAGSATERGKADGTGSAARFSSLGRMTVDADGNLYVVDGTAIRRVTPSGEVSTYAGAPDVSGATEGHRTAARFGYITGLAFDGGGNLFVADTWRIVRISPTGNAVAAATTSHDSVGSVKSIDGPNDRASIGYASTMASLPDGNVAYFDSASYTVRIVTPAAAISTLAGGGPRGGFADGVGTAARIGAYYTQDNALIAGPAGTAYLADAVNRRVRRLALDTNRVDTLAGSGDYGSTDGAAGVATFYGPTGLAQDAAGNLYVADSGHAIRRISSTGVVSLLAGKYNESGSADGAGTSARFNWPGALVVDSKGHVIVADKSNFVLRRISPTGVVTTLAGKVGENGYVNGTGSEARLGLVRYLAIDAADNVYFTDSSHAIRKVSPTGEVGPVAGAPYSEGHIDDLGAFARLSSPAGLAFDSRGNLFVADAGNHAIRRITPGGHVSTVAGGRGVVLRPGLDGSINQPAGLAVTASGRLIFVSEGAIVGD
ncbi:hypothetical protein [Roseateles asaccharophilus]|uniref:Sugar lactone lactonase YvrE n=1 Tax=Roseateles asaccharophilus TaxID=582607 RepID=A0ABU2AFF8_9BURK|nr:hypothetical protein [Roseateles asaccharophilus]MDR7335202.1 sugar lactone lactonase YvrE [Roseateles asaccharophilus]